MSKVGLCAFEDTGACLVVAKQCELCSYGKLAIADKERILVVLPCKVGEAYYGICQEVRHIKGKWKTERWIETGKILNFHITAELSTTEAEVKRHQRDIEEHSEYWFTGAGAKERAEAELKRIESIKKKVTPKEA